MNKRHLLVLGGLLFLIGLSTAVLARIPPAQSADSFIYLPLVFRRPHPIILTFQAEPAAADPGQTVTISWMVADADALVLTRYWDFRAAEWWADLPAAGNIQHIVPEWERNPIYFTLDAYHAASGERDNAGLSIQVICPDIWFFTPAPNGCPTAPLYSPAAEQQFEGGIMFWIGAQDRIVLLYDDTQYPRVSSFTDDWDGGPICDLGPAPAGMLHPARGFGHLWCTDETVRNRLGWATTVETGFETIHQQTTMVKYNHTYLLAADGNVWHLLAENSGWEKIIAD